MYKGNTNVKPFEVIFERILNPIILGQLEHKRMQMLIKNLEQLGVFGDIQTLEDLKAFGDPDIMKELKVFDDLVALIDSGILSLLKLQNLEKLEPLQILELLKALKAIWQRGIIYTYPDSFWDLLLYLADENSYRPKSTSP